MKTRMNKKILTSLLVIGVVGVVAAGSTFALFNDTETSDNNTFRAGTLDVEINVTEGEIPLEDVKPGDQQEIPIEIEVESNPAFVSVRMLANNDSDNSCTEPEAQKETGNGTCDGDGELDEHLKIMMWHDSDGDNNHDQGEKVMYNGTLDNSSELSDGIMIDANPATEEIEPVDNNAQNIGLEWSIPMSAGNEIQTDSLNIQLQVNATQARHNNISGWQDLENHGEVSDTLDEEIQGAAKDTLQQLESDLKDKRGEAEDETDEGSADPEAEDESENNSVEENTTGSGSEGQAEYTTGDTGGKKEVSSNVQGSETGKGSGSHANQTENGGDQNDSQSPTGYSTEAATQSIGLMTLLIALAGILYSQVV